MDVGGGLKVGAYSKFWLRGERPTREGALTKLLRQL